MRDFLIHSEFEHIVIRLPRNYTDISAGNFEMLPISVSIGRIPIEDNHVIKSLKYFSGKVSVIGKRYNGIRFSKWGLRNQTRGIVYSMDGNTPGESSVHFLTDIEPLSEERWYFYITNYPERRNNQRNNE